MLVAAPLLAAVQVHTTSEDESIVHCYTLSLDGSVQAIPPAPKAFQDGCALCYTEVTLRWQPIVTLDMLHNAAAATMQHLSMLSLPVHLQLEVTNPPRAPLQWHLHPSDPAQAAANAFATILDAEDICAVAGHADNNDDRPT